MKRYGATSDIMREIYRESIRLALDTMYRYRTQRPMDDGFVDDWTARRPIRKVEAYSVNQSAPAATRERFGAVTHDRSPNGNVL